MSENVRIVEVNEDIMLYDTGHVPGAVKVDWQAHLNEPVRREFIGPDAFAKLMDSIGERLTASPNMKRANDWTRDKLAEMGLSNAHLEAWGPFGRGWANQYVNARMISRPVPSPVRSIGIARVRSS